MSERVEQPRVSCSRLFNFEVEKSITHIIIRRAGCPSPSLSEGFPVRLTEAIRITLPWNGASRLSALPLIVRL
jgi:hypothetical protein